jgi:hypothetical protein
MNRTPYFTTKIDGTFKFEGYAERELAKGPFIPSRVSSDDLYKLIAEATKALNSMPFPTDENLIL